MTKTYEVVGSGNAIVDVLAKCDDQFLTDMGIEKRHYAADRYCACGGNLWCDGGGVPRFQVVRRRTRFRV